MGWKRRVPQQLPNGLAIFAALLKCSCTLRAAVQLPNAQLFEVTTRWDATTAATLQPKLPMLSLPVWRWCHRSPCFWRGSFREKKTWLETLDPTVSFTKGGPTVGREIWIQTLNWVSILLMRSNGSLKLAPTFGITVVVEVCTTRDRVKKRISLQFNDHYCNLISWYLMINWYWFIRCKCP